MRLRRDALTWLTYLLVGCYGYVIYGFGPSVPLLREEQGTSRAVSALHSTALAAGTLIAGAVFAAYVARRGRGASMWTGLGLTCVGVAVYTGVVATPPLPVTLAGAALIGLGGSFVINGHAAVLMDHHGAAGPAAISEANATSAGLGIIAPLLLGAGVAAGIGWQPGLLVALGLAAAVALALGRVRVPDHREAAPPPPGRLPGRYWLAWLVLVCCIGVEFALTVWSSEILVERTGVSRGVGTAAVTAILVGFFAGRLAGGRLALRRDPERLLLAAIGTAAAGFAVFWLAGTAWLAMAGLVVAGLGMALHFPLGIARALAASGGRPDLAAARASWSAGVAAGGAPFLLGALADRTGTHRAALIVPVLLAAAAAAAAAGRTPAPAQPTPAAPAPERPLG